MAVAAFGQRVSDVLNSFYEIERHYRAVNGLTPEFFSPRVPASGSTPGTSDALEVNVLGAEAQNLLSDPEAASLTEEQRHALRRVVQGMPVSVL